MANTQTYSEQPNRPLNILHPKDKKYICRIFEMGKQKKASKQKQYKITTTIELTPVVDFCTFGQYYCSRTMQL